MPARNTLVQLLAAYTNPESHNAQCHRQTDRQTDGQTDGQQDDANSRSYCVAVRSAKTESEPLEWIPRGFRECRLKTKSFNFVFPETF